MWGCLVSVPLKQTEIDEIEHNLFFCFFCFGIMILGCFIVYELFMYVFIFWGHGTRFHPSAYNRLICFLFFFVFFLLLYSCSFLLIAHPCKRGCHPSAYYRLIYCFLFFFCFCFFIFPSLIFLLVFVSSTPSQATLLVCYRLMLSHFFLIINCYYCYCC